MSKNRFISLVKQPTLFFKKYEKILFLLLLFLLVLRFCFILFEQRSHLFVSDYWQRYPELKRQYYASQYGRKNPEVYLLDETVNAFAGGAQITGTSPIFIAPDTPPLGRYLIGVSAFFFKNEHVITIFSGVVSLLLMFFIGKQIYTSSVTALIPPLLFSFEPMFRNQFIFTPLLDIIQLMFLLFAFYTFNKTWSVKKFHFLLFLLSSFFIGCFMATKFFATGVTIVFAMYAVLLFSKQFKHVLLFTLSLPVAVLILLSTYLSVFAHGYSFMRFLGIQKWVWEYHKSQLILPFSIWPLILLNKWYVWFGDKPIISDPQWRLSWPLITFGSFGTALLYFLKFITQKKEVLVLIFWVIFYFLFFSFGQISARYFVILIPVLYMVTFFGIEKVLEKVITR